MSMRTCADPECGRKALEWQVNSLKNSRTVSVIDDGNEAKDTVKKHGQVSQFTVKKD